MPLLFLCAAAIASSATAVLRGTAVALADASLADGLDGNDTEVQELLLDRCGWLLPITPGDQPYTKTCQRNLCCSAGGFCGSTPAHCLITNDCQKGFGRCDDPEHPPVDHVGSARRLRGLTDVTLEDLDTAHYLPLAPDGGRGCPISAITRWIVQ